jgi:hypothetical protein
VPTALGSEEIADFSEAEVSVFCSISDGVSLRCRRNSPRRRTLLPLLEEQLLRQHLEIRSLRWLRLTGKAQSLVRGRSLQPLWRKK